MRVIFMGTPDFAAECLKGLLTASFVEVLGVVTQPDKARGRGQKVTYSPVKEVALKVNLPVYQPEKVNDPAFLDELESLKPDAIVVVAYGQLLKERLLTMTRFGCINVHGSILPRYRGASPIHRVIINGETKTGITTMYMDKGWDTGDMILKEEVEVGPEMTVGQLHDLLAQVGSSLLVETLKAIEEGRAPRTPQNHEEAVYAPKLEKEDGIIHWARSAEEVHNLVRGMDPWPGAFTQLNGEVFKIWKTRLDDLYVTGTPGEVVKAEPKEGILVQTGRGLLWIMELQPSNGKRMLAGAYLNGHQIQKGEVFVDAQ